MNSVENSVLNAIDEDGLITFLRELISIKSLIGYETPAQKHVALKLRELGLDLDVWQIDMAALKEHPSYSAEVDRTKGVGVVGALGSGRGPTLILNGHVDVVPAGDLSAWSYPPFEGTVVDKRVYGRGALDMKGGLSCAVFAAKAIQDAGVNLRGRLLVQSVIGEEDGGCGTLAAVLRGHIGDGAIVIEPTELMLAPAQAGALNFRITIPGKPAHGAMRNEGVDPVEKFFTIFRAIRAFEAERNAYVADPLFAPYQLPFAICMGRLSAGHWASTVAESLTVEGRFGIRIGEEVEIARRAFRLMLEDAARRDPWLRDHPPRLEWWGGQFAPASTPASAPIVETVGGAFSDITNRPVVHQGMTYGADMRLLANEGHTPTVLFGPGDVRRAHRPDEYVDIDELVTVTRTLALTALRFCEY